MIHIQCNFGVMCKGIQHTLVVFFIIVHKDNMLVVGKLRVENISQCRSFLVGKVDLVVVDVEQTGAHVLIRGLLHTRVARRQENDVALLVSGLVVKRMETVLVNGVGLQRTYCRSPVVHGLLVRGMFVQVVANLVGLFGILPPSTIV